MIQENIMSQEPGTSKNQVRDKQVVPKSQVLYCYLFGAEERQGKKKEEKKMNIWRGDWAIGEEENNNWQCWFKDLDIIGAGNWLI